MSCGHIITQQLIKNKEKIRFSFDSGKNIGEFNLDENDRFIKDFRDINIDVTIVEITPSENIPDSNF